MFACRHMLIPAFVSLCFCTTLIAQPPARPDQGNNNGVEELTRGPIHEAFGEPIALNPKAGPIIPKEPPPAVEEVPPDEKPEGDNVVWIPGYWQWDDDSRDFIWVSGIWRAVPPDRSWVPGYWIKVDNGYQWVAGFWSTVTSETQYQPAPPESLENGPTSEATSDNQIWVPGVWVWRENRYMWRPGFWMTGYADWIWVPAHYCWTPSGYVFIDGYWDYPLYRRGLVFAPVIFPGGVRAGYIYTPQVVLDLAVLASSLFVRPAYQHYYFGDYYASNYFRAGYYPWFSYHGSRYGYDPIYAHLDWINSRRDPNWERRLREVYIHRRDTPNDRPPHTYRAYQQWVRQPQHAANKELIVAHPLSEAAKIRDFPVHLQHIDGAHATEFKKHVTEMQKMRDSRRDWEQKIIHEAPKLNVTPKPNEQLTPPVKIKVPKSPVVVPRTNIPQGTGTAQPKLPAQPQVTPHSPGTVKPHITLPNPEQMIRPDFNRGHGKNGVKDSKDKKDNKDKK